MTKRLLFLLSLLILPLSAAAQMCGTEDLIAGLSAEDRARLDALVAPHPYPEGNLWTATKDGSTVTVVGTIHIPDPRLASYVDAVRPALETADLLILESSLEDEKGLPVLVAEQPNLFFLNEGPTLIDLLSEEDWAQASDRLAQMGVPSFFAAKFQPWYLSMTLAMPPCAMTALKSSNPSSSPSSFSFSTTTAVAFSNGCPLASAPSCWSPGLYVLTIWISPLRPASSSFDTPVCELRKHLRASSLPRSRDG